MKTRHSDSAVKKKIMLEISDVRKKFYRSRDQKKPLSNFLKLNKNQTYFDNLELGTLDGFNVKLRLAKTKIPNPDIKQPGPKFMYMLLLLIENNTSKRPTVKTLITINGITKEIDERTENYPIPNFFQRDNTKSKKKRRKIEEKTPTIENSNVSLNRQNEEENDTLAAVLALTRLSKLRTTSELSMDPPNLISKEDIHSIENIQEVIESNSVQSHTETSQKIQIIPSENVNNATPLPTTAAISNQITPKTSIQEITNVKNEIEKEQPILNDLFSLEPDMKTKQIIMDQIAHFREICLKSKETQNGEEKLFLKKSMKKYKKQVKIFNQNVPQSTHCTMKLKFQRDKLNKKTGKICNLFLIQIMDGWKKKKPLMTWNEKTLELHETSENYPIPTYFKGINAENEHTNQNEIFSLAVIKASNIQEVESTQPIINSEMNKDHQEAISSVETIVEVNQDTLKSYPEQNDLPLQVENIVVSEEIKTNNQETNSTVKPSETINKTIIESHLHQNNLPLQVENLAVSEEMEVNNQASNSASVPSEIINNAAIESHPEQNNLLSQDEKITVNEENKQTKPNSNILHDLAEYDLSERIIILDDELNNSVRTNQLPQVKNEHIFETYHIENNQTLIQNKSNIRYIPQNEVIEIMDDEPSVSTQNNQQQHQPQQITTERAYQSYYGSGSEFNSNMYPNTYVYNENVRQSNQFHIYNNPINQSNPYATHLQTPSFNLPAPNQETKSSSNKLKRRSPHYEYETVRVNNKDIQFQTFLKYTHIYADGSHEPVTRADKWFAEFRQDGLIYVNNRPIHQIANSCSNYTIANINTRQPTMSTSLQTTHTYNTYSNAPIPSNYTQNQYLPAQQNVASTTITNNLMPQTNVQNVNRNAVPSLNNPNSFFVNRTNTTNSTTNPRVHYTSTRKPGTF